MTTFDEAQRLGLYSESFLDNLGSTVAGLADPAEADPQAWLARRMSLASRRDPVTRAMVADI